jgi:hypothetical protein
VTPEYSAYKTFLAIRNHFRNPDYDYFFYRGKSRGNPDSFRSNKNYYQFVSLSKKVPQQDMVEFIACNFAHTRKSTIWITDLLEPDAAIIHQKYRAYIESATYRFENDLKLVWPLTEAIQPRKESYPIIVSSCMSGKINLETFCLLNRLTGLLPILDKTITEKYLWPRFRLRVAKFEPFIRCEDEKLRGVLDKISETK